MKLVKTLAIFGVLLVIAAMPVMGQLIHDMQYLHIAPTVIPVDTGGSSGVGVIRIDQENTGPALYVQSVVVAPLPADTLGTADI